MVLQSIRERLTGIIAIFIFAILIIPFAFVGVNSYFTSDAVNSVARVNDMDITTTEFSQGFQNYRRRMQSLMGENFDPEQFDQPIIRRQFLDSLIDQRLLGQISAEAGLSVDDESLARAIREIPGFQVDGEFSADVYQARLLSQGISPQQFENDMRTQLVIDQFPGTITASSIATDWELQQFVRLQDQERVFKAILVEVDIPADTDVSADVNVEENVDSEDAGNAADSGQTADETKPETLADSGSAIDETEIVSWYESHAELYRSKEQVIIEYLELDAAAMEEDIVPDDDQLRARFEEQKARFVTPETRLASHILIEVAPEADDAAIETARQIAEGLTERARAGEDFEDLAKEFSQDAGSASLGGDLGWVEPGFMVQAFEDGLYALTNAQPISDPVQTGFGWHVIYLRDLRPAEGMAFEEARDILQSEFLAETQERKFLEQADRLVDLIYEDPTTLNAAAEVLDLEVKQEGPFGREGGSGISAIPQVRNAAYSDLVLQQGGVSDPVDLGENHIVMLRVKQHMPEDLLPLTEVRDRVISGIKRAKATQDASDRAEELLAQLQAGADITTIAEEQALKLLVTESARRNSTELPPDLLAEVFKLQLPENDSPQHVIVTVRNGYAVVQLEQVIDGDVSKTELSQVQNYRRRISNATANAEARGFLRMLRNDSEIEVFEDKL